MEKSRIILELIKQNKTLEEIIVYTNLPVKEIYKIIRKLIIEGHNIARRYFYDGEIEYSLSNQQSDNCTIITSNDEKDLEFMIISDLHLGSIYEMPKLLDIIYDYCTKNNIHIILNSGDLVEGEVKESSILVPPQKQLDHALRVYPLSPSILNFLLLGNHDYSLLMNYGIDILDLIKERREDIIPIGYGEGQILIKNDHIVLQHPLIYREVNHGIYDKTIIIRGHGHAPKISMDNSNLVIYAPSLSKLNLYKSNFPGAIDLKIKMKRGFIEYAFIEELSFINNCIYTTNEISLYVGHRKSFKEKNPILNEEAPRRLRKEL